MGHYSFYGHGGASLPFLHLKVLGMPEAQSSRGQRILCTALSRRRTTIIWMSRFVHWCHFGVCLPDQILFLRWTSRLRRGTSCKITESSPRQRTMRCLRQRRVSRDFIITLFRIDMMEDIRPDTWHESKGEVAARSLPLSGQMETNCSIVRRADGNLIRPHLIRFASEWIHGSLRSSTNE